MEPGSGIEIPGADFDETLVPENMELDSDQLRAVIGDAGSMDQPHGLSGRRRRRTRRPRRCHVDTWRRIVELNPALEHAVLGTDQAAIDGDG